MGAPRPRATQHFGSEAKSVHSGFTLKTGHGSSSTNTTVVRSGLIDNWRTYLFIHNLTDDVRVFIQGPLATTCTIFNLHQGLPERIILYRKELTLDCEMKPTYLSLLGLLSTFTNTHAVELQQGCSPPPSPPSEGANCQQAVREKL